MSLRLYREHAAFHECSAFDVDSGRLRPLDAPAFEAWSRAGTSTTRFDAEAVVRRDGAGFTVFDGDTFSSHTRFPRRIYFQITRRCNLQCPYCFLKAGPGEAHVPTPHLLRMARYLGERGLIEVRLTGGEPTTHPDCFAVIDAFRREGVYVSVATNGTFSAAILAQLAERRNLWVIASLDGGRESHERYRPGTFDRIVSNLERLKSRAPETRLRLTLVLTRANRGDLWAVGRMCKQLDAESLTVIPLRPQVRQAEVQGEMVDAGQFLEAIEKLVRIREILGVQVTTTIATDHASAIYPDPVVRKRFACAAGREATNLDYDARSRQFLVYGCSYSPAADLDAPAPIRAPFLAGTFSPERPEQFGAIWRDEAAWTLFREESSRYAECEHCRYRAEGSCVGSCPIQNIDYTRIATGQDVLEQLSRQLRSTAEWYCYKSLR